MLSPDGRVGRGGLIEGRSVRLCGLALQLTAVLSVLAVMAVGCSSTKTTAPPPLPISPTAAVTTPTSPAPAPTTPAPGAQASTTAPATGGLSGTWSGQYAGAYQGTFTLSWQQSVSHLSGTIKLPTPPNTLGITGNVQGSAITFGAVGAVTYSGTISAKSCPAPTSSRPVAAASGAPPRPGRRTQEVEAPAGAPVAGLGNIGHEYGGRFPHPEAVPI